MNEDTMNNDVLIKATLHNADVRLFAASTQNMVEHARQIHGATPTAIAALGRTLTAVSMMGSMMKNEQDKLTVTIQGGGPGGRIIVVGNAKGQVKGYIEHPEVDLPIAENGKLKVGTLVGKEGRLSVIREMGLKNPYVGQCELLSGEIAEDFAYYFTQSEQKPSLVALGVLIDTDNTVKTAGGLILQPMPGCPDEVITEIEKRSMLMSDISRQLEVMTMKEYITALFRGLDLVITEETTPQFVCDCSKERMEKALISLGTEELAQIIEEDEKAELTCHFCLDRYQFSKDELQTLLNTIGSNG